MDEISKIAIIFNEKSGSKRKRHSLYAAIEGLENITIYPLDKAPSLEALVKKAWDEGYTSIVAAGGDGTVSGVVSAILKLNIPAKTGVLPLGTFNHFARDIDMPKSIEAGIDVIRKGTTKIIDVAKMNNKYFINNSSLGLYPFMVKERDLIKRRGIAKWWRMIKASITTFNRHPYITVEFKKGKKKFTRKTPFIFIGNNSYKIEAGGFGIRKKLDEGKLTVFLAHEVTRLGLVRLGWHALRGKLIEQKDFDSIGLASLKITSRHTKLRVSHDGEISKLKTPISYSILPKALHVIIP